MVSRQTETGRHTDRQKKGDRDISTTHAVLSLSNALIRLIGQSCADGRHRPKKIGQAYEK